MSTLLAAGAAYASDGNTDDGEVTTFATLPDGVRYPEGITAVPATGNVYVGTFDARMIGANNKLLRYGSDGNLIAMKDFGVQPRLGLGFANTRSTSSTSALRRCSASRRISTAATPVEDVASIPTIGPPTPRTAANPDMSTDLIAFGAFFPAPNALVFDHSGNMYVSGSFQR